MTAVPLTRPHAEEYHPFRLLGIAQVAMELVARLEDPAEIKQVVADALARITVPAIVPLKISERLRSVQHGPGTVMSIERDNDIALIRWDVAINGQHVLAMGLRWAETECLRGAAA
jgi:hypothetical protein